MTTLEIIRQRVEDLRQFFICRFGYGWQTKVKRKTGTFNVPLWFRDTQKLTGYPYVALARYEALAVKLGYKLGDLDRPFERKNPARRKVQSVRLNSVLSASSVPLATLNDAQSVHPDSSSASPVTDSSKLST